MPSHQERVRRNYCEHPPLKILRTSVWPNVFRCGKCGKDMTGKPIVKPSEFTTDRDLGDEA